MAKNILSLDDFKSKKSIKESTEIQNKDVEVEGKESINEMVEAIDDFYRVGIDVDLPKSLVSSFIKKVKESTGKDLRADIGEKRLAERLVQWATENYLNIENLPVEIVTGSDKAPVQGQSQAQPQVQDTEPQAQDDQLQSQDAQLQAQDAQLQGEKPAVQAQPQLQSQVQSQPQAQAQKAAAQIPAQEI